jgi:hypothetical protein
VVLCKHQRTGTAYIIATRPWWIERPIHLLGCVFCFYGMNFNRLRVTGLFICLVISCLAFTRILRLHSRFLLVDEVKVFYGNSTRPRSSPIQTNVSISETEQTLTLVASETRVRGPKGVNQSICTALLDSTNNLNQVYYLQTSCNDVHIGNKLSRIYMTYAMARAKEAQFRFICPTHKEKQYQHSILSLLALDSLKHSSNDTVVLSDKTTLESMCATCNTQHPHRCPSGGIDLVVEKMRQDLNRIASQEAEGGADSFDIALHYRCGDILGIYADKYGLLPHSTYANLIRSRHNTTDDFTVAIISNLESRSPTDDSRRPRDSPFVKKCQLLVQDLVEYLKARFPIANISIPPSQSIAQDYFRLIRARSMAICGPSTFCLWPTLANPNPTIYKSRLFPWVDQLDKEIFTVYTSPRLKPKANQTLDGLGMETILSWLQNN